jgi:uncharacterized damage-inducible protein DinB
VGFAAGVIAMLARHFRKMARNNAWANDRLLKACAALSASDFAAARTNFFPSLRETLNHVLTVDWYYLDALERGGRGLSVFEPEIPYPEVESLARAQTESDRRLIAFCDRQTEASLADPVVIDRGESGLYAETVADTLAHLFQHQIHHRGQAHAMLAGTGVPPPQLDEYFLAYDAERRRADLASLGIEGPEQVA